MTDVLFVGLTNSIWQLTAIYLVGLLAVSSLRRASANFSYLAWVAATVAASTAPWISLYVLRNDAATVHTWAWRSEPFRDFGLWLTGNSSGVRVDLARPDRWHLFAIAACVFYAAWSVARTGRLINGWLKVRRVIASSSVCDDARTCRLLSTWRPRTCPTRIGIRLSDEALVPFAVGFRNATVVLPQFLASESDDVLSVVLAHELAHIDRNDWLLNLVLLVISLPLSFHPCIAFMLRRVQASREAACDELASGCVASPSIYARALLDLASMFVQHKNSLAAAYKEAVLGVFDGSTLSDRVRRLMDRTPQLSNKTSRWVLAVCLTLLLMGTVATTRFALASPPKTMDNSAVAGVWTGQLTDRNAGNGKIGHSPIYLQLQRDDSAIKGVTGPDANNAFPIQSAEWNGDKLHFTAVTPAQNGVTVSWNFDLTSAETRCQEPATPFVMINTHGTWKST
jgi:beta-lactamase regulating signal transducer with metallopeptidase domain